MKKFKNFVLLLLIFVLLLGFVMPLASAQWYQDDSTWYYTQLNGNNAIGWQNINNTWYYFHSNGAMATGWIQDGSTWYYMRSSGAMATGWVQDGSTWYYMHSSGAMATGWIQDGSTWYYMHSSGEMAIGKININGNWHEFNTSGAWIGPTSQPPQLAIGTVLLDKDGVKILYNGINVSSWSTEINIIIENNSDRSIMVQTREESINKYMISASISSTVTVGNKANTSIRFSNDALEKSGITEINEVELYFLIINPDTYGTIFTSDNITLQVSTPKPLPPVIGTVLFDQNNIRITYINMTQDRWDTNLNIVIENNSDRSIMVQTRDESVNGYMIYTSISPTITAGKRVATGIRFSNDTLEKNGITIINEVDIRFLIINPNTYGTIFSTDIIKIKP